MLTNLPSSIKLPTFALALLFTFSSCGKYQIGCADEEQFCSIVQSQDFDEAGPMIDDFLASLRGNDGEEHLRNLREWLECSGCVRNARIICKSCIETYPAQSEIRVDFVVDGQKVTKILDIYMGKPLTFHRFHD